MSPARAAAAVAAAAAAAALLLLLLLVVGAPAAVGVERRGNLLLRPLRRQREQLPRTAGGGARSRVGDMRGSRHKASQHEAREREDAGKARDHHAA